MQEALLAELAGRVTAATASATELSGELQARRMAAEADAGAAEQRQRQVLAADALISRWVRLRGWGWCGG